MWTPGSEDVYPDHAQIYLFQGFSNQDFLLRQRGTFLSKPYDANPGILSRRAAAMMQGPLNCSMRRVQLQGPAFARRSPAKPASVYRGHVWHCWKRARRRWKEQEMSEELALPPQAAMPGPNLRSHPASSRAHPWRPHQMLCMLLPGPHTLHAPRAYESNPCHVNGTGIARSSIHILGNKSLEFWD